MIHYTTEEIMSMPGYCRDKYEREIAKLEQKIEQFKKIAVHVQEHCCDDCEDTTMCEFGCAITELKSSIVTEVTSHDGIGDSERAKTRKSLNCRNDETPSQNKEA